MGDEGTQEPELLAGGVANAGAVVRVGDVVERPAGPHAVSIHALLHHVRANGFDGVPEPLGAPGDGRERLRFIPGDVPLIPFPAWFQGDDALCSAYALLRRYHDACLGFDPPAGATWSDEMADPTPGDEPIWSHSDLCPENIVFGNGRAVAFLDFDFVAPGRRTWDLASTARYLVPVDDPVNAAKLGWTAHEPARRLPLALDAYGLTDPDLRREVVAILGYQIERGGEFVRRRIEAGEQAFIDMWNEFGGSERFDRRREWFASIHDELVAAVG